MTDKQIIIDGHDVSKGNQKYMKESSPVENWYKAKINTVDGINLAECVHFTRQVDFGYCELSNDSCNEFQYNCVKNKNCYYKQLKRKEQECEALASQLDFEVQKKECLENECERLKLIVAHSCHDVLYEDSLRVQLDQLKAEVKSKTEYIQEQREIITQYSEEIRMYKMCQGERASKREEKIKAENKEIKNALKKIVEQFGIEIPYCKATGESTFRSTEILKLKQTLQEIKEIAYELTNEEYTDFIEGKQKQILQKISEVEDVANN